MTATEFVGLVRDLAAAVPDAAAAFVFGALSTALGSWIAHRYALKQQRLQFVFEKEENQRDRQLQLRRDVYLPAAEATVNAMSALGRILDMAVDDSSLAAQVSQFEVAIGRVQLIASAETIQRVSELQRAYMIEYFALMRDRVGLRMRQSDIDIAHNWMTRNQQERDRYIEMMKALNLGGNRDQGQWARIQSAADFASEQYDEFAERWRTLMEEQLTEQQSFYRALPRRLAPMMQLQVRALTAIRNELETGDANDALLRELESTNRELQVYLEQLLTTVRPARIMGREPGPN